MVLLRSAPAPESRPTETAVTWLLKVAVWVELTENSPDPRCVRSTVTTPDPPGVPSDARVTEVFAVLGATAAPATTPPEPATVLAKLSSLPVAVIERLAPFSVESSPR